MIGIVASIAGVVTLLSILIAVYLFLQRRRGGRARRAAQRMGIEGGPDFTGPGASPPLVPPSAQSSANGINIINKPLPYPMEEYTSTPTSPYFVQAMPNNHTLDRDRQMQSLNAATADLDQILNAPVFTPIDGTTMSPSTPHSRGAQTSPQSIGTREQPKATIPISPLSFISNFRDSIVPASYIRAGITEAEFGAGGRSDRTAARRSSTTVKIPGRDMMDRGGRDGRGDPYL